MQHKWLRSLVQIAVLCVVWGNRDIAHAAEEELEHKLTTFYSTPQEATRTQNEQLEEVLIEKNRVDFVEIFYGKDSEQYKQALAILRDPSIAYNVEATNTTSEAGRYSIGVEFPIRPLMENTTWGELHVELIDANGDETVFLNGAFGGGDNILVARVRNSTTFETEVVGTPLGTDITSPGMHSFILDPLPGPTPADKEDLVLTLDFILSPGDTVHITSQFIIDEGTGLPFVEIPDFPNPANGPYLNVINVDSPETSLPEDFTIGPQTQLNLFDGGEIGHALHAGQTNADEFDVGFDVEVNVDGGIIRRLENSNEPFRTHGNSIVNLSGGTIEYLSAEHDSVINVSGGRLGADNGGTDAFETMFTSDNAVANISGGFVEEITAVGASMINMTDGSVGDGTRGVNLRDDSVLNLSGGTVARVSTAGGSGEGPFVSITGGNVVGSVAVRDPGTAAHVSGGSVETISATNGGRFTILGGTVSEFATSATGSTANIAGGTIGALRALTASTLNLFGREFLLDGVPVEGLVFGVPTEITDRDVTLSGLLADGTAFSFELHSENMAPVEFDWIHPDALLTVTLPLPGDFDLDVDVDGADYLQWQRGESFTSLSAADLALWQSNYGDAFNKFESEPATVPEPSGLFLAAIGCIWWVGRMHP